MGLEDYSRYTSVRPPVYFCCYEYFSLPLKIGRVICTLLGQVVLYSLGRADEARPCTLNLSKRRHLWHYLIPQSISPATTTRRMPIVGGSASMAPARAPTVE